MIPTLNDDPRWTIVHTPWSSCSWTHGDYVSFAGWGKSKLETKLSFNHIIIWTKNQNSVIKTTYVISWCPWIMKINKKLLKWSKLFSWKIVIDTNLITCLNKNIEAQLTSVCSRCPTAHFLKLWSGRCREWQQYNFTTQISPTKGFKFKSVYIFSAKNESVQ